MSCELCEDRGLDHEAVKEACVRSLLVTARVLCDFPDVDERFHGKVAQWFESNIRGNKRNMLVLLPRGHLKTHLLVIAGSIWLLINNPETRILLVQASAKKAHRNMFSITAILESAMFRHYFGDLISDKALRTRWNQEEVQINRTGVYPEPSITARGVTSRVVGDHYDVIFEDDIIDLQDKESATMDSAIEFHKGIAPLFVNPVIGLNVVIGTRWAQDDLYGYILETQGTAYETICAGFFLDERSEGLEIETEDVDGLGAPIWFGRYGSSEAINALRSRVWDEWEWSHQYLNIALSDEMKRFKREDIQWFDWVEPNKTLREVGPNGELLDTVIHVESLFRVMTVDPAVGERKDSDDQAIITSGIDRKTGSIYVLEAWATRAIIADLVRKIMEIQARWKPDVVGIEEVGFAKTIKWSLREAQQQQDKSFAITPLLYGGKSKIARIEAMTPYTANRKLYLCRHGQEKLLRQLIAFHPSMRGHDDAIDALAHQVRWWRTRKPDVSLLLSQEEMEDRARPHKLNPLYGLSCAT